METPHLPSGSPTALPVLAPGWQSSEFILALVVLAAVFAALWAGKIDPVLATTVIGLVVSGYPSLRTWLKAQHLDGVAQVLATQSSGPQAAALHALADALATPGASAATVAPPPGTSGFVQARTIAALSLVSVFALLATAYLGGCSTPQPYYVSGVDAGIAADKDGAISGGQVGVTITTTGSTAIQLTSTAGVYPGQEITGTGIPAGAHIASVPSAGHAVMTLAATGTSTAEAPITATLGGGKVPTLYPTYVKALSDFHFSSLGEIGAAFDNNRVPYESRCAMLTPAYYSQLAQDPAVNSFFAATRSPDIISKGLLPELNGFTPQKAPWFPTTNNRVGFAYHPAAIVLKSRLPQDFTKAVSAMVPGSVTTVTDPDTRISVLHIEHIDLVGRYAESSIEVMLGAAVGDPRAGLVLTSA